DGPARLTLLGGALVRLATGARPDADVPLDLGSGDGQVDIEGRVAIHARPIGPLHLRVTGRHGRQRERTTTLRVAPPGTVLTPVTARTDLLWHPASYRALQVEPFLRLTPTL